MASKTEDTEEMSEYTDYDPPFCSVEYVDTPAAVSSDPVSKLSRCVSLKASHSLWICEASGAQTVVRDRW